VRANPSNNVAEVAEKDVSSNPADAVTEAPDNREATVEEKTEDKAAAKKENPAPANSEATPESSPSASEAAANPSEIDASQASSVQPLTVGFIALIVVVGAIAIYSVLRFLPRRKN
jgi:hypothetical protein